MNSRSAMRSPCSWVRRSIVAVIASVGVVATVAAAPASAVAVVESYSAPLSRTTYLGSYCPGTFSNMVRSGVASNPDNWHSNWKVHHVDKGGNFETIVYRQTGVTQFDVYLRCTNSSQYRRIDSPTQYVHRYLYQNWICYGGSCQYLGKSTSGWKAGA